MQSQRVTRKTSKPSSKQTPSDGACPEVFYLTPEKRTKPNNFSPGKKPIRFDSQSPNFDHIAITPFMLF